jgi:hydroxypyruvate reductase
VSDRALLAELHDAARAAVHGGRAVERSLREHPPAGEHLVVLAAGKAACAMARGAVSVLGPRILRGRVTTREGYGSEVPPLEVREAAHPIPDARSVAEGDTALRLAEALAPDETLLVLLSGGASALWCAPERIELEQKRSLTQALLVSGANISELNAVRKHLSRIKGGGLARAARGAGVLTLAVSDVAGDLPDAIGSGPTAPDPTRYQTALGVLSERGLLERFAEVRAQLERGASGAYPETLKPGAAEASGLEYRVVARLADALEAARARAHALGLAVRLLGETLYGEVRAHARQLAEESRRLRDAGGGLLIAGGEPLVEVRGSGLGGRCQELALAFALEARGLGGVTALFAGTDGSDGPTDAAGGFSDAGTLERAAARGLDAAAHLAENDAHTLLEATGDLYRTGPTDTNVTDLALVRVRSPDARAAPPD